MSQNLSITEHREIARELEKHHALFERVWAMGRIRYSTKIPTAAVLFNKSGELIDFIVNRNFWEGQTFTQKCFVVSHECLHIALNHGARGSNVPKHLKKIVNMAQDLVINHTLTSRYGFVRSEIDPDDIYCWVDKIFPDRPDISTTRNFEYYYNLLADMAEEQLEKALENSKTVDDHGFGQEGEAQEGEAQEGEAQEGEAQEGDGELDKEDFDFVDFSDYTNDFSDAIEKLNEELTQYEKETLESFIKDNDKPIENPNDTPTGTTTDKPSAAGEAGAGTESGNMWTFAKKAEVVKKHKFEHIITSWARGKMKDEYKVTDQWVHKNRRFSMIDTGLMLPTEYETMEREREVDKIEVWFFQDTSGSCHGYTDRFFSIAEGMPLERFNMRMFCFDTKVYETSLESRKLYGFGGTSFHILENRIIKEMENDPKFKYPEAIFVVTDGYGTDIVPRHPKNWHWILTPGSSKDNIPSTCNFYDLASYT